MLAEAAQEAHNPQQEEKLPRDIHDGVGPDGPSETSVDLGHQLRVGIGVAGQGRVKKGMTQGP